MEQYAIKSVAFGGFDKEDVARYIEQISQETGKLREERDALREQAESLGMQAVVEVCGKKDLVLARESGARIIQVNARDLDTLRVDRQACLELARQCPPERGEIWIAASGMDRREHLEEAARAGFSAALVGTALMQEGQPGAALRRLLRGREDGHHAA